jgi:hypothetical protein
MTYDRKWVVDMLRGAGYLQAADEAARTLPETATREQLEEFADRYNISRDELVSWKGGSP